MGDPGGHAGPAPVVVRVTADPIRAPDPAFVSAPSDGALVVFFGIVRDSTEGRAVESLLYEAYDRMAEDQMMQIGDLAREKYGATHVLLVHRTGDLRVGEVSVMTAVSAPHRDSAFLACRFCIDAIKERAAIWKKEIFGDGGSRWVEGA